MPQTLYLIFNHRFTPAQEADARASLGVDDIKYLPAGLEELWRNIPPELPAIGPYLEPLREWLAFKAQDGDFVLVQGDFGACYLMVSFAFERSLIPIYSTTRRQAAEEPQQDGSVMLSHQFRHEIFRRYGS